MTVSCHVVVVAPDASLRRSLEFALEVEGFLVHSYTDYTAALASPHVAECICLVIDEEAILSASVVIAGLLKLSKPIVLLSDGLGSVPDAPNMRVLRKPLLGNTLIRAIRMAGQAGKMHPST